MIEIMIALLIKHFLADYVFNPAYQPTNKHIYGSTGSLAHSGTHMAFCFLALMWFLPLEIVIYPLLLVSVQNGLCYLNTAAAAIMLHTHTFL